MTASYEPGLCHSKNPWVQACWRQLLAAEGGLKFAKDSARASAGAVPSDVRENIGHAQEHLAKALGVLEQM